MENVCIFPESLIYYNALFCNKKQPVKPERKSVQLME